ncbi:MAG: glycerol-3-phosphate responsive antiterminator [Clostridia bacterium]|nr:glycerol-3-phosphate responsive antiterminator [Clostridia bacterium]
MTSHKLIEVLEFNPIIAAVHEDAFEAALASPAEVIFYLKASLLTVRERVAAAHAAGKSIFVHVDLAEGVGKDRAGVTYLADLGVDGIISTRTQLLRYAKELGLVAVQRFFALDSQGMESISETLESPACDLIEIMPGVIGKAISRFAGGRIPVIAGGLIETKAEVTSALNCGAIAVSTGNKALWYID